MGCIHRSWGVSPAFAGGLGGDLVNTVFPGAGTALDNANRQLKERVPAYKQLDEGGSAPGREVGKDAQKLGNDIIATAVKAGNDIITTAVKATLGRVIDCANLSFALTLCEAHDSLAGINGVLKTPLGLGCGVAPPFYVSGSHTGNDTVTTVEKAGGDERLITPSIRARRASSRNTRRLSIR
jgi:hypothetical protein